MKESQTEDGIKALYTLYENNTSNKELRTHVLRPVNCIYSVFFMTLVFTKKLIAWIPKEEKLMPEVHIIYTSQTMKVQQEKVKQEHQHKSIYEVIVELPIHRQK